MEFLNKDGFIDNNINKDTLGIKIYGFWSTGCGTCAKKFKSVENVLNSEYPNSKIQFYSIGLMGRNQTPLFLDSVYKSKFNINSLGYYIKANNPILRDSLGIYLVPNFIIKGTEDQLNFKGSISNSKFNYNYIGHLIE